MQELPMKHMPQQMGEPYAPFHLEVSYVGAGLLHSEKQDSRPYILAWLLKGEKA